MRLPKLEKVESDIAGTKARIAEYQTKLRELEKMKVLVENDRMIRAMRDESISDAELNALIESFRKSRANTEPAEAKPLEATFAPAGIIHDKEEPHDANTET